MHFEAIDVDADEWVFEGEAPGGVWIETPDITGNDHIPRSIEE